MSIQTRPEIDMTVRSFDHVARQLARSPSLQYEHILREADKHRSALQLVLRDVIETALQGLRNRTLEKAEFDRMREALAQTIAQAQQAIDRIAAQYAPHRLAA